MVGVGELFDEFGMAKAGEIKKDTLGVSPTRTNNKWVEAKSFEPLAKMIAEASQQVAVVEATAVQPSSSSVVPVSQPSEQKKVSATCQRRS